MGQPVNNPPHPPNPGDRLESWKEIATYFKRSVRTVQDWEKKEALPVHRHLHDKLGSVYAYREELDAWWRKGRARLGGIETAGENKARERRLPVAAVGVVAVALALAVGMGMWLGRSPILPFGERDWILIAQFNNRTGEPVFDGVLEYALERELSNSRFVNVVPRDRVNDSLLLMQRPPDTLLTAAVGREVCLRDGEIRALLTGQAEKLNGTYLLSVALVNPVSGVTVRRFDEEASGQQQVVPALRRLSGRVRNALGEALVEIQESEQALEKVTTPSLRALQLFSQADRLLSQAVPGGRREDMARRRTAVAKQAEELLRQAIAEDPNLAAAHLHLAVALRNQGRPAEEYLRHAERAVELSGKVSDRERHFILGSYYQQKEEGGKAVVQFEALVRRYPDHYWGNRNLALEYERLGRPEEAVPYVKRQAHLRPNDLNLNCRTSMQIPRLAGRVDEARPFMARARWLFSQEAANRNPQCAAYLDLFAAYEHLLEGRAEQALAEAERVAETLASRSGEERDIFTMQVAGLYFALGMLKRAEELFRREPDPALLQWNLARIDLERGDSQGFKGRINELSRRPEEAFWFDMPICYARVGLLREADAWIQGHPNAVGIEIARGELALARGQKKEGLRLLQEGYASLRNNRSVRFFNASEGLARALEQKGELEGAAKVLEHAGRERVLALAMGGGGEWNRLRFDQARLYRKLGREPEAQRIEGELRRVLAYADPDHIVLRELRSTSQPRAGEFRK